MYKRNIQGWLKHFDFILLDAIFLQISFIIAYMIRHGWSRLPYEVTTYRTLAIVLFIVDILVSICFNTMHNVMRRGPYNEFIQSLKQSVLVLVIMTLYLFSVQAGDAYSRITIYLTAGFHLILGYLTRLAWKPIVRKFSNSRSKRTMILVADEAYVEKIVNKAKETDELDGFNYSGLVLTNRNAEGEVISGLKVVANLSNAAEYICREWVDEVFIFTSLFLELESTSKDPNTSGTEEENENSIEVFIEHCRQMAIPIHIRLPISSFGGTSFIEKVGGYDVLTTTANFASPFQLAIKRALDIVGGIIGSLAALVVIAIVGPMIKKESPGPILFKQTRIGKNGKRFTFYKIRSMYMDAEDRKKELLEQNRVSDGMMFKLDFDPRIIGNKIVDGKQVTGIGEKIRSTSLDEFPQFFNVLMGQMSLVGTRPPTLDEWEKYKFHHRARLSFKPGLTGLWQVSGRSKITDFEEVVKLDTNYIQNWSIGLDLKILLKTVKAVFAKEGAM